MLRKLTTALLLSAAFTTPAFAQTLLIKDANVAMPSGLQTDTDLLIIDGRINAIADNIVAPNGAQIISADGQWVTPGIIAPFSYLGLVDISGEDVTNDITAREALTSVSERAADSFNPRAVAIANTRRHGITHALISPNASGDSIFAGTGSIIDLSGNFDSIKTEAAFVHVVLGESGASRAGGSRAAAMTQIRSAISDAKAYKTRYNSPSDGDALPRRDALALVPVVNGDMPLMVTVNRAMDILNVIKLKKQYGLDIIILGAAEGWQVANQLAEANMKVIIDPHDNLPSSFETIESRLDNVVLLDEAGVDYAIANISSLGTQKPSAITQHAGNAVGNGLSWDKAFKAISQTPADWFGLDNSKLSVGGTANLVVWDGDPLLVTSAPTHMLLDGTAQSLESRQTALRDRYFPLSEDTRPHKYR
ncbi:MAG: amidohydrolase [Litorimonas sp.]